MKFMIYVIVFALFLLALGVILPVLFAVLGGLMMGGMVAAEALPDSGGSWLLVLILASVIGFCMAVRKDIGNS